MRGKLRQLGILVLGIFMGVMISVNFSAVAQRDVIGPLPVEELRAFTEVFGRIKSDYVEPVDDKQLIRTPSPACSRASIRIRAISTRTPIASCRSARRATSAASASRSESKTASVKVVSPIEDTPAYRSGIKAGDLIIKIDGEFIKGMTLSMRSSGCAASPTPRSR